MKEYTRLAYITLQTAWITWYEVSCYACAITTWFIRAISFMAILTYILGKETRIFLQPNIDSFVESCIRENQSTLASTPFTPTPPVPIVAEPTCDYTVQAQTQQPSPTIADFTSAQLKAIAKDHKVPRYSRMNKTELFDTLLRLDLI